MIYIIRTRRSSQTWQTQSTGRWAFSCNRKRSNDTRTEPIELRKWQSETEKRLVSDRPHARGQVSTQHLLEFMGSDTIKWSNKLY